MPGLQYDTAPARMPLAHTLRWRRIARPRVVSLEALHDTAWTESWSVRMTSPIDNKYLPRITKLAGGRTGP